MRGEIGKNKKNNRLCFDCSIEFDDGRARSECLIGRLSSAGGSVDPAGGGGDDFEKEEEAMMQPRDAHDDGDCAMEEAGALLLHSSPLPAVMTLTTSSKTNASSPSSSNQQTNDQIRDRQRTASPLSAAAADALVGARKRKAIRVVKHQQVSPRSF